MANPLRSLAVPVRLSVLLSRALLVPVTTPLRRSRVCVLVAAARVVLVLAVRVLGLRAPAHRVRVVRAAARADLVPAVLVRVLPVPPVLALVRARHVQEVDLVLLRP